MEPLSPGGSGTFPLPAASARTGPPASISPPPPNHRPCCTARSPHRLRGEIFCAPASAFPDVRHRGSSANRRVRIGRFSKPSIPLPTAAVVPFTRSPGGGAVATVARPKPSHAPSTLDRQGQAAAGLVSTACEEMLADWAPLRGIDQQQIFPKHGSCRCTLKSDRCLVITGLGSSCLEH